MRGHRKVTTPHPRFDDFVSLLFRRGRSEVGRLRDRCRRRLKGVVRLGKGPVPETQEQERKVESPEVNSQ